MRQDRLELARLVVETVQRRVAEADTVTAYRKPLVGCASADDPRFRLLRHVAGPDHMMPRDLLPGARSVVSFFIPFGRSVVRSNARARKAVAPEWAVAYLETNDLIGGITDDLVELLHERGVGVAAEPATGKFDPVSLTSRWSHKSVGVIAGLGSLGLHQLVITEAGCAGRFGSLVVDAELPRSPAGKKERCGYFHDGSCRACIARCPVEALSEVGGIDRAACWTRCQEVAAVYAHLGVVEVCGKCAVGPCSFESSV
ncbi:MAG: epoxyqueuosine reductase [Anaerolineae bacterium]|jgi:epoxyqueuosine reductase QueG